VSTVYTLPDGRAVLPVRALAVEVIAGPDAGRGVVASSETLTIGTAQGNDLVLSDPRVSRFHAELAPASAGLSVVDHDSTNGTFANGVRIERAVVPAGTVLMLGSTQLRVGDGRPIDLELADGAPAGLVGRSPLMRRLVARVQRAAQSDASVLIHGESGTGKELVARAVHSLGPRAAGPFVVVDCGALSPTLVASELFGHERGAFTGAERQHQGAFERAHGGTLFLDEIGELPPPLQAALLGVLERRAFRRLGGQKELSVDVRVVAATNRDLRADVNASSFRLDLYYRIAVATLELPPLRARADDVPLLVEHFLRECGHAGPVQALISPAAMEELSKQRFPGNVRELRNLIEGALALGEPLQAPSAATGAAGAGAVAGGAAGAGAGAGAVPTGSYKEARASVLADFEARYLGALIQRTGGNVSRAAREAGMDRSHLIDLLRRHGLRGGD